MTRFLYTIILSLLSTLTFSLPSQAQLWPQPTQLPPEGREIRAAWYCTLGGMDWPRGQYAQTESKAARQRQMLCDDFDRLQAAGINVILFQCRTRGMVLYQSDIETWDACISGDYGVAPSYDPLAFAIEEAHRRGMELHAYLVTYPMATDKQVKALGKRCAPASHPSLCQKCDGRWYLDPGAPGTAAYIAALCREIVEKYEVDGIHLDYIRYPEKEVHFNDAKAYRKYGNGQNKAEWRRQQVTATVRAVHDAVKAVKPWVILSCSPVGKYATLPRADSFGWNARDAVFQDAQAWLRDNLMDWLLPMMYFDGRNFYPFALNWQQESYGHPVAPGLGIYLLDPKERNWEGTAITRQLNFLRQQGIGGQAFFRTKYLLDNHKGIYDFCKDFYRQPALTPASTWLDTSQPAAPVVSQTIRPGYVLHLEWEPVEDATPIVYNVYHEFSDGTVEMVAHHLKETSFDYAPLVARHIYDRVIVRAMNAYKNESISPIAGSAASPAPASAGE